MRYTPFATLFGYLVLAVSSALAQTTTPPGTAPGTATTPGAGAGAGTGGGLADWWWIILVLLVVAAAISYFMTRPSGRVCCVRGTGALAPARPSIPPLIAPDSTAAVGGAA